MELIIQLNRIVLNIPHRLSSGQDYWGYYNGEPDNTNMIPRMTFPNTGSGGEIILPGVSREPNFVKATAGTLKKMIYPTGGHSNFYYQPHTLPSSTTNEIIWYKEYLGNVLGGDEGVDSYNYQQCEHNNSMPNNSNVFFVVEEEYPYEINYFVDELIPNAIDTNKVREIVLYKIQDEYECEELPNGDMNCFTNYNTSPGYCELKMENIFRISISSSGSYTKFLTPGVYGVLILNGDDDVRISASVDLQKRREITSIRKVGGLRTYRVESKDETTSSSINKYYYYGSVLSNLDALDNLNELKYSKVSSAIQQHDLRFYKYDYEDRRVTGSGGDGSGASNPHDNCTGINTNGLGSFYHLKTIKRFPSNQKSATGPHITYSTVSTIEENNGFTITRFYNEKEISSLNFPYSKQHHLNGTIKNVQTFNNSHILLKEEKYTYNDQQSSIPSLLGFSPKIERTYANPHAIVIDRNDLNSYKLSDYPCFLQAPSTTTGNAIPCSNLEAGIFKQSSYKFNDNFYEIKFYNPLLIEEETIEYYGDNKVAVKTNYVYQSEVKSLPSKIIRTKDANQNFITQNYYPQDIESNESFIVDLIDNNRIAEPIQVENYISSINGTNKQLLATQITKYDSFNELILPKQIQRSKGENAIENRIVYHNYDAHGNPTELSKTNGTHISYIWGYNHTYPVAKIENATNNQIENVLGEGYDLGNNGLSSVQINALRSSLLNAQVTTYTYTPLVGITSITDPRGYTMYYEYDSLNRLQYIKDSEGNIVSENKYNYKN